jgi:PelA/Pel-15E family pectate lyase
MDFNVPLNKYQVLYYMTSVPITGFFNRDGGYNSQIKTNGNVKYTTNGIFGLEINLIINLDPTCIDTESGSVLPQDIYVDIYINNSRDRTKISNPGVSPITFLKSFNVVDEGTTVEIKCLINRQTTLTHTINDSSCIKLVNAKLIMKPNLSKSRNKITIDYLINNKMNILTPKHENEYMLHHKIEILNHIYNDTGSNFVFSFSDHTYILYYDLLICIPKKIAAVTYRYFVTGNMIDYVGLFDIVDKISIYNLGKCLKRKKYHHDFKLWSYDKVKNICSEIYVNNILSWMFGAGISDNVGGFWSKDICNLFTPYTEETIVKHKYGSLQNGTGLSFLFLLCEEYKQTKSEEIYKYILMIKKYLMEMRYENGGIPQYYPNTGGRFALITLNDGAFLNYMRMLELLLDLSTISDKTALQSMYDKSLTLLLDLQITQNGKKTIWAQQYDATTLLPAPARSFEPIALCSLESSQILHWLMKIKKPNKSVTNSIKCGCEWYEMYSIQNLVQMIYFDDDFNKINLKVYSAENHNFSYLWPRYADLVSNEPFFMNRKGEKFYDLNKLDKERRIGYTWLGNWGSNLLCEYKKWQKNNK